MSTFKDITGQKFGNLTAVEYVGRRHGSTIWRFSCDCGNIVEGLSSYFGSYTKGGGIPMCKQCSNGQGYLLRRAKNDITGQKFGELTAIEFMGISDGKAAIWRYRCDCGREITREHRNVLSSLNHKTIPSCGECDRKRLSLPKVDLTGMKFGKLTAIRPLRSERDGNGFIWEFQCECGNIVERLGSRVSKEAARRGIVPGCGIGECGWYVPYGSGRRAAINSYKASARDRNIDFDLTDEQMDVLFSGNCEYCGSPPMGNIHGFVYNGIDRVNNARGYFADNVVSCCKVCNRAKNDMNCDDFIAWLDHVAAFRCKDGS